ncbi:hypothetical protein BN946_scf184718.g3 [Trametes cinnabarina]|uniref:Uncharacterized protein n=1 Tax=Pycnoporus cinnabarinus TaxID=5643 RepID=A0A060SPS7_PYCCI|nr:hypothetical protein BN946_scf184718.g3 [Trametes cinnabarina]
MITNGGNNEGLFYGAIMDSGSPLPTGDIELLQPFYETVVEHAGCARAADTLACLRTVSTETIMTASAAVPNLFNYPGLAEAWAPRADGVFLKSPSQHLVLAGSVADHQLAKVQLSTDKEFRDFVRQEFFPTTPESLLSPLFELYPDDPAAGSPFGTGDANELAPQFKRMAAFQGDVVFQAPRRFCLDQRSLRQPAWSFMTPNPNGGPSDRTIKWPQYDPIRRSILEFVDGEQGSSIAKDTARLEAMAALTKYSLARPF